MNNKNLLGKMSILLCGLVTFSISNTLSAPRKAGKDSAAATLRGTYREMPSDKYIPVNRQTMQESPAFRIAIPGFFAAQVNVNDSSRNIVGDAANEPSIAIDPTNPNRMAIGWRQFNTVSSNFRQAGHAYSMDAGHTWTFPGVIDSGIFRSDPVLDSDLAGRFYYNSLTVMNSTFSCDVFRSNSGGRVWDDGAFARGGDKQWMTIDKIGGPGNGNIYASWTSSWSECFPGFFTRSANRGASYENCTVIPGDPFWGSLAVGPNRELYVCGAGDTSFIVAKSTNASNVGESVSWDTTTVVNLDGEVSAFPGSSSPNPGGLLGQAWVAVDQSNGAGRGNVFVLCSVARNSNADPLDVMFARSTNGGRTWSAPVRVNDDTGTTGYQWFGTMSAAPNGRIDAVWLDTRDNTGSVNSALYYSSSTDAGVTWSQNVRLSGLFNPHLGWPQQNKMGDYFHMISDSTGAHLAWAGTFNGEQDVYYGRITLPLTGVEYQSTQTIPARLSLSQNYPNPFNPSTTIAFGLPRSGYVTLSVFNVLGEKVATLIADQLEAGTHAARWNATGVASGVYIYRLTSNGYAETKRMIVMK